MSYTNTITLNDTEVELLQYVLCTHRAENAICLRSLVSDTKAFDTFVNEYRQRFHLSKDVSMQYIRPESIARYLQKRIEEQLKHEH